MEYGYILIKHINKGILIMSEALAYNEAQEETVDGNLFCPMRVSPFSP